MKRVLFALVVVALASNVAMAFPTYNWPTPTVIPDNVPAGVNMDVAVGDAFVIGGPTCVSVGLTFNPNHTWVGDLIVTLSKVGDGSVTIMNRTGSTTAAGVGDSSNFGGPYTIIDGGANVWTAAAGVADAVLVPAGNYEGHTRTGTFQYQTTSLCGTFNGVLATGTWRLNVSDNAGIDTGTVSNATLTLTPEPSTLALLSLGALALIRRRR